MRKGEIRFEKQSEGRQSEARGEAASRPIHLPVYAFNSKAKDSTSFCSFCQFMPVFLKFLSVSAFNLKVENSRTNNHAKKIQFNAKHCQKIITKS